MSNTRDTCGAFIISIIACAVNVGMPNGSPRIFISTGKCPHATLYGGKRAACPCGKGEQHEANGL
jgi:hypothetical protein